jgi:membrane protease YdiL (CAAX protease family)
MKRVVQAVFWNNREQRVRALWRLAIFGSIIYGLLQSIGPVLNAVFRPRLLEAGATGTWVRGFYGYCIMAILTLATLVASANILSRRSFREYGLQFDLAWWRDLGFGVGVGVMMALSVFSIQYYAGWVKITARLSTTMPNVPFLAALLAMLLRQSATGFWEEVAFRGYPVPTSLEGLQQLSTRTAATLVMSGTSLIFGLAHLGNENATAASALAISVAGIPTVLSYVFTGRLGLAIGAHAAWNFCQGHLFGYPVSGTPSETSVFQLKQEGPALWTGGSFGPEAGLLGFGVTLVSTVVILVYIRLNYGRLTWSLTNTLPK